MNENQYAFHNNETLENFGPFTTPCIGVFQYKIKDWKGMASLESRKARDWARQAMNYDVSLVDPNGSVIHPAVRIDCCEITDGTLTLYVKFYAWVPGNAK